LLKNSDTLGRQTLAENQKLNYAGLMNNSGRPHRFVRSTAFRTPQGADKKLCVIFPRNQLKSLDSDERIQENPNKSNPHKPGVLARNS
jgi:hypothetical protein